ncbi:putative carboxyvinyl-carboxyphosphonate phosphorylmutase [Salinisphaera sp. LB1]|nr:putative carboxyvinyl-carboxyphosphonate phosphorylmutase [Salinisphaera sp. LB1]
MIRAAASQAEQAQLLRSYYRPGNLLILPNVWDAASARAVEKAGFAAIATGSAGIAAVLGYADHEAAPVGEMFDMAKRIARVTTLPVTVDAEAGDGLEPAELVERLKSFGAAGCNL